MRVFRWILPSPRGVPPPPPPPLPLPFPLPSLILPKCPLSQRERALSKIREGRGKGSGFVIATELCIMECACFPDIPCPFQSSSLPFSHLPEALLSCAFPVVQGPCPFQSSRLSFSHFWRNPVHGAKPSPQGKWCTFQSSRLSFSFSQSSRLSFVQGLYKDH